MQLVSIICTCYNHSRFVIEALESVFNQSYKNIEIIIIDDASSDNSVNLIENWLLDKPNILFLKNEENKGITTSFNKASKHAKGEFLIDLATDDVLNNNCIKKQVEKFNSSTYTNLGLVYGNVENINEDGTHNSFYFPVDNTLKTIEKRNTGYIYTSILDTGKSICSPSAMFKKDIFERLNGYDESLVYEDLDFWLRLSKDYQIDYIDDILVKKRITKNSLGSHFEMKKHSNKINHSTFKILVKAFKQNTSRKEDSILIKRVNYEIVLNLKNRNYNLLLKYLFLKIRIYLGLRIFL